MAISLDELTWLSNVNNSSNMSACNTIQSNLSCAMYFMCVVVTAAMVTSPNFVLASSNSTDNHNNNNTRDWNFYRANVHNLTAVNDTGTLKDCNTTGQIGPCWDSSYKTFVP
jgi:hypothetical protein